MGIEILERAAESRGRILKAERLAPPDATDDPLLAVTLVLTFDVGRVRVAFQPGAGRLEITQIEDASRMPTALEDLAEAEPWWRVIGNGLARVSRGANAAGESECVLQFREDDENPKRIGLRAEPGGLRVVPDLEIA